MYETKMRQFAQIEKSGLRHLNGFSNTFFKKGMAKTP